MSTATPDEPIEYACQIPPGMVDDRPAFEAHWRRIADEDGFEPIGEPTAECVEPVNMGTEDEPLYPFGDEPYCTVRGPVQKKPVLPLPMFVPSREAVEQAAQVLVKETQPTVKWDDLRAHQKNYYARMALSMITAASSHLVADTAQHVGENPAAYAVPVPTPFTQLAEHVRGRLRDQEA